DTVRKDSWDGQENARRIWDCDAAYTRCYFNTRSEDSPWEVQMGNETDDQTETNKIHDCK
ncbi:hypothetical protein OS493_036853, partial [Desmophyllum pertusum]